MAKSKRENSQNEYEGGADERFQEPINYSFMDGIRGIGSLSVYLSHFFD